MEDKKVVVATPYKTRVLSLQKRLDDDKLPYDNEISWEKSKMASKIKILVIL